VPRIVFNCPAQSKYSNKNNIERAQNPELVPPHPPQTLATCRPTLPATARWRQRNQRRQLLARAIGFLCQKVIGAKYMQSKIHYPTGIRNQLLRGSTDDPNVLSQEN